MTIRDVLNELGIEFQEHTQSSLVTRGWVGWVCPFCGKGGKPGMGVNTTTLKCSCWKCGSHNLASALVETTNSDLKTVLQLLSLVDYHAPEAQTPVKAGKYTPPPGLGSLLDPHKVYLRSRGLDPDQLVEDWNVGGIGPLGQYRWRVFIPVMRDGRPVSWTTRAVGKDVKMRYLSAPPESESHPLKHCLLGEDLAEHSVCVVEGPMDALKVGPGAVSLCGVSYTREQVHRIARFPRRVIAFDNEDSAQRRASKLADDLSCFPGETLVVRVSCHDPGELRGDDLRELREMLR